MEWTTEKPKSSGKYVVRTTTKMGNHRKLESTYNADTGKWSFNNQLFHKYLNESK